MDTEETEQGLNKIGGRKFFVSLLTVISATVLTWYGKIDPGVYSTVVIATVGAYIAGNVYQKTNINK